MIRVHDLYKTLGTQEVLRGVSMHISPAQTHVILGRSGSGKSVLLKHLVGLFQPDSGQVLVDGEDISKLTNGNWAPSAKRSAFCFRAEHSLTR
jgi:phospholipid/cholesterol/gamma-HCH transport system ATP-binding protein